ncbi:MAG: fibronectin type III domain-containing protein, partial [Candidatus Izemoplasmatales bacterium]|nr:fibronectin type III domain-containing protein [Candidatus Izemoplasmatales bacterium]
LHGKISPNECSFDIDNTNLAYTISNLDIEGQLVEVWVDSTKQFTGYAEKPTLTRNGRTVHVQAFDKMKQLQKLKCVDKMFIGSTADAILTWLVETCGGIGSGSHSLDSIVVATGVGTTQAIVGYALYSIKDKLTDKLQEIVDSVGGTMWFDESGILQFRAGFAASWSTSTEGTITVSKLKDIDSLQWLPSEGDRVIVKSKNRSVKTEKEPIFTWAGTVTSDGLPTGKDENGNAITDDQWRAKFDSPAIDVDDYATVNAAKEFDSGLTLNQTVYDANFDTGVLKYPDFMYLQIDNSSGVDKNVTKLVIEGKPVVENYLEVIYDAGSFDVEREVSNDLISSKVWASSLAKWLYENGNDKFEAVVPLADFSLGLGWSVGDKVNIVDASTGLSHRAWVRAIDIDYRNRDLTVTLRSDRASAFSYSAPPGSTTGPGTNIPYEPQFGDGSAPATPTGLSLTAFAVKNRNYIKATWDANTEEDLIGYEVQWNYDDGATWYNVGFINNNEIVFEVTNQWQSGISYTVYVQVRAVDIENLRSSWSASDSETILYDTTPPATPGSISATGGVGLIYVNWTRVYDSDVEQYYLYRKVQTEDGGSFGYLWDYRAVIKGTDFVDEDVEYHIQNSPEDSEYPNQWRKYIYAVRATDYSANYSPMREMSTGDAVFASQATGPDIAVNAIKANHLEVALDLSVGRQITVGSGIQIGADVGPSGLEFDGIYVTNGTNYVKLSAGVLELKADLMIGAGDNIIEFEDANISLGDTTQEISGNQTRYYLQYKALTGWGSNPDRQILAVGYALNSTDDEWHSFMEIQNRFDDYTNLARFNVYVKTGSNLSGGNTVQLGFYAYSLAGTNLATAQLNFVREAEASAKSWLYCDVPIKHVIPYWYGTDSSATSK